MSGQTIPPFDKRGEPSANFIFWDFHKKKDNRIKLKPNQKGLIFKIVNTIDGDRCFFIKFGKIQRYPLNNHYKGIAHQKGCLSMKDVLKGKNKGRIEIYDIPYMNKTWAIEIITHKNSDFVKLKRLERQENGDELLENRERITLVVAAKIKKMGLDLKDNPDNIGKTLSPELSQYLYDFIL